MAKGKIIAGAALLLLTALAPARARSEIAFTSAPAASVISLSSAEQKAYEETFSKTFDEVIAGTTETAAIFSVQDEDILSWEESGQGKYLYFLLTPEKNDELAGLTRDNIGKPLRLNIGDHFIMIPEITGALHQSNGFVLMIGEDRRTELMHSMLDWAKKAPGTTSIDIAPAVIDVPEIPKPAPAKARPAGEKSGPADSIPQSVLQP